VRRFTLFMNVGIRTLQIEVRISTYEHNVRPGEQVGAIKPFQQQDNE
jgi:hypothetical protein